MDNIDIIIQTINAYIIRFHEFENEYKVHQSSIDRRINQYECENAKKYALNLIQFFGFIIKDKKVINITFNKNTNKHLGAIYAFGIYLHEQGKTFSLTKSLLKNLVNKN